MKDYPHGTYSRYTKLGCRCIECKRANTEKRRRYRERVGDKVKTLERLRNDVTYYKQKAENFQRENKILRGQLARERDKG